jgi:hypothetical protein
MARGIGEQILIELVMINMDAVTAYRTRKKRE